MSQYEMSFVYICGEDNTVADALSRLDKNVDDGERSPNYNMWCGNNSVNAVLTVSADVRLLEDIRDGYKEDDFCKKLGGCERSFQAVNEINGLWYIGEHLVIPQTGTIHEDLFRLAHDTLRHFGARKSYSMRHYETLIIGQTCERNLKMPIFWGASHVRETKA
jgi:hypothetical protein